MPIPMTSAYARLRQRLAEDQRRPIYVADPLWRLLLGEVVVLASRVGRWRVCAVAVTVAVVVTLVEVALAETTPGPVLRPPWRWLVAAALSALTILFWAVRQAYVRR